MSIKNGILLMFKNGDDNVLVLAKAMLALMIGFILSIICGFILIPLLKKNKAKQTMSIFLKEKHKKKEGTPTMGGFIFIIPTILTVIILLLTNKIEWSNNLLIILFVFLSYGLIGFIDDFLIIKRKNNIGLTEFQKIVGQLVIALITFYLLMKSGHEPQLYIYSLGIKIHMAWFYGIFLLFILVASSNAVNITDGLDGLAGGLSLIVFLALGLITWNTGWLLGHEEIAIFCFILVGSLLGFLFYNTYPAKIFMGDVGSLSLGATMAIIAVLTSHEVTFIIMAGIFIVETLVCIIQMASIMIRHKKVFLMTPLHHHFEKLGWEERDIVKVFWVIGLILAMIGVLFAVWI
ncbi:MAG: phospho-N-acetylmuramoyl-pentapeptide-transferase [Bacilli bacterium]|nr:phospho-N-acetylmuramoyl-pentapeptide-transferase [Bacilli bacterium]